MAERKVIAVVGATGAQGGGLVRAINADPEGGFVARALVRDPGSEKAQQLAAGGAEVIAADLDDPESIRGAFEGAYGAFCVTFFWAHLSAEKEKEHARTMAAAARDAGLRHVIWSTLEDTREYIPLDDDRMPTLGGNYKVPHFDAKGESDHYFTDLGVPTTFLLASFYWENLIYFGLGPARGEDGRLAITMPIGDKKNAGIGSEDIGRCAYGIFRRGSELSGRRIGIAGEHLTGEEMAAAIARHIGEEVSFNAVDPDTFRSFGFPGADEVGNMFQFYRDFDREVLATRDVEFSRQLNPSLQNFDQWLADNAQRIPIPPR
jgi:uncharacterized protein YbjT (DUF2867 family)